jgi:transcriptional regulator GlxA family with amidase domain
MDTANGRLTVALLAIPEITASTLYGMYDIFAGVGRDWAFLMTGSPGEPLMEPLVVSADAGGFQAANGVWIRPQQTLDACPSPDILCIPEVFVAPDTALAGRYAAEIDWIRRCYGQGATLATACSGALMLAEAGLLDGQEATTHWGFCDTLASRYPAVRVLPNRALVVSGHGQRIVMAGGGTSWQDVALYLIARFAGVEEAMRVARVNLIDWHDIGQQPFAALTTARQVEDAVIARCQAWVAEHYDESSPVAAMVRLSGLGERSFKRRFARATGMPPIQYVHTLRLEEAKQILETTEDPVEAVANQVGYEDASFFGRLFRRKVGLTPAQYRRRFGAMRRALQQTLPQPASGALPA